MKILKVVVDELPEECGDCQFFSYERYSLIRFACSASNFRPITVDCGRPDWCPLESEE